MAPVIKLAERSEKRQLASDSTKKVDSDVQFVVNLFPTPKKAKRRNQAMENQKRFEVENFQWVITPSTPLYFKSKILSLSRNTKDARENHLGLKQKPLKPKLKKKFSSVKVEKFIWQATKTLQSKTSTPIGKTNVGEELPVEDEVTKLASPGKSMIPVRVGRVRAPIRAMRQSTASDGLSNVEDLVTSATIESECMERSDEVPILSSKNEESENRNVSEVEAKLEGYDQDIEFSSKDKVPNDVIEEDIITNERSSEQLATPAAEVGSFSSFFGNAKVEKATNTEDKTHILESLNGFTGSSQVRVGEDVRIAMIDRLEAKYEWLKKLKTCEMGCAPRRRAFSINDIIMKSSARDSKPDVSEWVHDDRLKLMTSDKIRDAEQLESAVEDANLQAVKDPQKPHSESTSNDHELGNTFIDENSQVESLGANVESEARTNVHSIDGTKKQQLPDTSLENLMLASENSPLAEDSTASSQSPQLDSFCLDTTFGGSVESGMSDAIETSEDVSQENVNEESVECEKVDQVPLAEAVTDDIEKAGEESVLLDQIAQAEAVPGNNGKANEDKDLLEQVAVAEVLANDEGKANEDKDLLEQVAVAEVLADDEGKANETGDLSDQMAPAEVVASNEGNAEKESESQDQMALVEVTADDEKKADEKCGINNQIALAEIVVDKESNSRTDVELKCSPSLKLPLNESPSNESSSNVSINSNAAQSESSCVVPVTPQHPSVETNNTSDEFCELTPLQHFVLPAGKKYRRSLSIIRNLEGSPREDVKKGRNYKQSVKQVIELQYKGTVDDDTPFLTLSKRVSVSLSMVKASPRLPTKNHLIWSPRLPKANRMTIYETPRASFYYTPTVCSTKATQEEIATPSTPTPPTTSDGLSTPQRKTTIPESPTQYTMLDLILTICKQSGPCTFVDILNNDAFEGARKLGEGVFGEVFSVNRDGDMNVLKIIPIEGDQVVNGEKQKTYSEILSELVIAKVLHDLRFEYTDENNCSHGFAQLIQMSLVRGRYPDQLLEFWRHFDDTRGSDNDCPSMFSDDQLFIVLEQGNGGNDLESYTFSTAKQALSAFKQIIFSLAVAECSVEFEHRDLHWGNVLISKTSDKQVIYVLNGDKYSFPTSGIKTTIIDYTLSRIKYIKQFPIYNDIGKDPEMFIATGDYQFDVYRQMKEDVNDDWSAFVPKTNVRWLYYLLDKLLTKANYMRKSTKVHKESLKHLQNIDKWIATCDSAHSAALKIFEDKY